LILSYLAVLDFVTLLPAIVLGYYAIRMVILSRRGRLENGWRLITYGAVLLSIGFLWNMLQDLTPAYSLPYIATDFLGTMFVFSGMTLLVLGFRSHYLVWSLKSFQKSGESARKKNIYENVGEDA
jgi:uncharacterized membrane protein HdeD (DUF308 family)